MYLVMKNNIPMLQKIKYNMMRIMECSIYSVRDWRESQCLKAVIN